MEILNAREWYEKVQLRYNDALDKHEAASNAYFLNPSNLKLATETRAERLLIEAENQCEIADIVRQLIDQTKSGTITLNIPEFNIQEVTLKW